MIRAALSQPVCADVMDQPSCDSLVNVRRRVRGRSRAGLDHEARGMIDKSYAVDHESLLQLTK